jgi:hypothetical protein
MIRSTYEVDDVAVVPNQQKCVEVDVPDGICGDWSVETFTVSEQEAAFHNLRCSMRPGGCHFSIVPGTYKRLCRSGKVIMSNTPAEVKDSSYFVHKATGSVLINGLGLGAVVKMVLAKGNVRKLTVIEISKDVIKLVAPSFQDHRLKIICADAFEYKPPKGMRYNAVWHDIWDDICSDNLQEMYKLKRRYGRRADYQECWAEEHCKLAKRMYCY